MWWEMNDEVETIILDSFEEMSKLKYASVGEKIVTIDIRNITVKEQRVRILDFVTGLAFGKNCTIKKINDEGVYLINPPNSKI